jgi:hypothetical protein
MLTAANVLHHEFYMVQQYIYSKNSFHHHIFLARGHYENHDGTNNLLIYNIGRAFDTT